MANIKNRFRVARCLLCCCTSAAFLFLYVILFLQLQQYYKENEHVLKWEDSLYPPLAEYYFSDTSSEDYKHNTNMDNVFYKWKQKLHKEGQLHHSKGNKPFKNNKNGYCFISFGCWGGGPPHSAIQERVKNMLVHIVNNGFTPPESDLGMAPASASAQATRATNEEKKKKLNIHFIIASGDNFYPDGVSTVEDEQFRMTFEEYYTTTETKNATTNSNNNNNNNKNMNNRIDYVPWLLSLGNHDYRGNVGAQFSYTYHKNKGKMKDVAHVGGNKGESRALLGPASSSASGRWYLPHHYYKVDIHAHLRVIVFDSVLLHQCEIINYFLASSENKRMSSETRHMSDALHVKKELVGEKESENVYTSDSKNAFSFMSLTETEIEEVLHYNPNRKSTEQDGGKAYAKKMKELKKKLFLNPHFLTNGKYTNHTNLLALCDAQKKAVEMWMSSDDNDNDAVKEEDDEQRRRQQFSEKRKKSTTFLRSGGGHRKKEAEKQARMKVLVAHYPLIASGPHEEYHFLRTWLLPLLKKNHASLYINADNHYIEISHNDNETDHDTRNESSLFFVNTGAGGGNKGKLHYEMATNEDEEATNGTHNKGINKDDKLNWKNEKQLFKMVEGGFVVHCVSSHGRSDSFELSHYVVDVNGIVRYAFRHSNLFSRDHHTNNSNNNNRDGNFVEVPSTIYYYRTGATVLLYFCFVLLILLFVGHVCLYYKNSCHVGHCLSTMCDRSWFCRSCFRLLYKSRTPLQQKQQQQLQENVVSRYFNETAPPIAPSVNYRTSITSPTTNANVNSVYNNNNSTKSSPVGVERDFKTVINNKNNNQTEIVFLKSANSNDSDTFYAYGGKVKSNKKIKTSLKMFFYVPFRTKWNVCGKAFYLYQFYLVDVMCICCCLVLLLQLP